MIIFLFVLTALHTISCMHSLNAQSCVNGKPCTNTYHSPLLIPNVYKEYPRFVDERIHSFNEIHHDLPEMIDIPCNAHSLISWWRFDLMAKYIYADHYTKGVHHIWARELYAQHLQVWGGLQEWDGSRSSLDDYLNAFHHTLDSIKTNGFDASISRIRIDSRRFPCEGAHRIIAALIHNKPVTGYYNPDKRLNSACQATSIFFSDYTQYVPTGLDATYLDAMALAYARLKQNTRMLIVFCSQDMCEQTVLPVIRQRANSIYYKQIHLTPNVKEHVIHILYPTLTTINRCTTQLIGEHAYAFILEPHYNNSLEQLPALLSQQLPSLCFNYVADYQKTVRFCELFFHTPSMQCSHKIVSSMAQAPYATLLPTFKAWCERHNLDVHDFCIAQTDTSNNQSTIPSLILHHRDASLLPSRKPSEINVMTTPESPRIIYDPHAHAYYQGVKWEILTQGETVAQ